MKYLCLFLLALSCAFTTGAAQAASVGRLVVYTNGVALSQFPSRTRLSQSVLVELSTSQTAVKWTATSSASWLTVTASGQTGQYLTLTANPAGLTRDQLHSASVSVHANALGSQNGSDTILVSLWVGSVDAAATVTVAHDAVGLAANPVQPWVYVSAGSSSIDVFNVYSGQLIATFSKVAPTVGKLVVSSDGRYLFAVDTTNYKIIRLNSTTGAEFSSYALAGPIQSDFSFAYARPDGHGTLFAAAQKAIDVQSGEPVSAPLDTSLSFYDPLTRVTPDGTTLFVLARSQSPGQIFAYDITDQRGKLTFALRKTATIAGENCQAMAISPDGSHVYPACGAPYEFDVYDGTTLTQVQTLPATPYPNNAVLDSNGDFIGGLNGIYDTDDVYAYDPTGYLLGVVPTTSTSYYEGQGNDLMAVSADSSRVISATGAPYNSSQTLMFRSLP